MPITLSSATTHPPPNQLQELFDSLWREVKRKQQANTRLQIELSEYLRIYHEKILPIEQLSEGSYSQLAQRLIYFFRRKNLAQWQRYELSKWIMECIDYIEALNPEKSCELTASYHQALAAFLQLDVEAIEEQMNQGTGSLDEFFADDDDIAEAFQCFTDNFAGALTSKFTNELPQHAANNSESVASGRQGDLFGLPEGDRKAAQGDGYKGGAFKDFLAAQNKVNEQNRVSDQWLTTLFRRTANALHPDKERNEDLRSEKQDLMAQLLAAREQKDVFSLLNLYTQYVDGKDLLVTDETMGKLCAQLNQQKHQLADEKQHLLHQHPVVAELYKKLHCRSTKKRDKNIERHIQDIQQSTQLMLEFVVSLRNLEVLKLHLADRYQERCDKGCGYDDSRAVDCADGSFEDYYG